MASKQESPTELVTHGASRLTAVDIDAYNAKISDEEGFVGDRASGRAFREILEAALAAHLFKEGCIGSASEIFDAEPPFTPRGYIAQAWSVAELLRCWVRCRPGYAN